jgi:hypothetical protein
MSFSARGAAAWLPLLVVVLSLQACGGGGGGGEAPSNPPVTGPPPPPAPTASSYSSPQSYTVGTAITPLDPTVTGTSVDKIYLVYHVGDGDGCSVARATVAPSCFVVKT